MQGMRRCIRLLRVFENDCVQRGALSRSDAPSTCKVSERSSFRSCVSARNGYENNFAMGLCTQTASEGESRARKSTRPTGDVRRLYDEMVSAMDNDRIIPNPHQLQELIRCASTAPEVALAMDLAARVRREAMNEPGKKELQHTKEVTHMMTAAFLRANDTQSALRLLWRKHPDGFTTSVGTANLLLKHAKFHKDVKLMRHILRAMAANGVQPTQTSADMILRMCKEGGDIPLMLSLAKEYHKAGLSFHDALLDVLISNAANAGDPKLVHEVQTWRKKQELPHTTASAVSMAKAFVLEGKAKEAALVIKEHCPAGDAVKIEKRERYLNIMVKVWPLQVLASRSVESKEEFLVKMKEDVVAMFERLGELGITFTSFDVSQHFAQGKGSGSIAQKEVKDEDEEPKSGRFSQSLGDHG